MAESKVYTMDTVLLKMHRGNWWTYTDWSDRIYANLRVNTEEGDDQGSYARHSLPTEEALNAEIARQQAEWDAAEYSRERAYAYQAIPDQLDKIYHDGLTKWKAEMVDPIKTKWPKDNSGPV